MSEQEMLDLLDANTPQARSQVMKEKGWYTYQSVTEKMWSQGQSYASGGTVKTTVLVDGQTAPGKGFNIVGHTNLPAAGSRPVSTRARFTIPLDLTGVEYIKFAAQLTGPYSYGIACIFAGSTQDIKELPQSYDTRLENKTTWNSIEAYVGHLEGVHDVHFVGGWWDNTGGTRAASFSDITLKSDIPLWSPRLLSDMEYTASLNAGKLPTITTKNLSVGAGYASSVLAPDGMIYFIPYSTGATTIKWVDPLTDLVSSFGTISASTDYWCAAVLGPAGRIYAIPRNSPNILVIRTGDKTVYTFGNITGTNKWAAGVLAPNGRIYCPPLARTDILVIDPLADTTYFLPVPSLVNAASNYESCVLAPNGKIYCIPYGNRAVLVIDTNNDTTYTFGSLGTVNGKWAGGVMAANGKIYCVPLSSSISTILVIDPSNDTTYTLPCPGSGEKYYGAVLGPDGRIYGIKRNATVLVIIDPTTDTITTGGSNTTTGLLNGTLAPNGKMYTNPREATVSVVFDLGLPNLVQPDLQSLTSTWYNKG